jgi:hypothetical protein
VLCLQRGGFAEIEGAVRWWTGVSGIGQTLGSSPMSRVNRQCVAVDKMLLHS